MAVEGLSDLQAQLRAIGPEVRAAVRRTMEKQANDIVKTAKSLVPARSGALRDSIGWTWGDPPQGSVMLDQSDAFDGERITIYAGNEEAFYARWVEFGTQPHSLYPRADVSRNRLQTQPDGSMHPGAGAHPFFFPAYRANSKKAKAAIRASITRAIKKALK